jgi:hypothetical protein
MGSSVGIDDSAATDSKRENVSISTGLSLPFLFRANLLCVRCPLAPAPLSEPSDMIRQLLSAPSTSCAGLSTGDQRCGAVLVYLGEAAGAVQTCDGGSR